MYGSMGQLTTMYIGLLFSGFSNVYHFACVWPTALKPDCVTNFDMLFLVMGFISLVDEIQFMLISSRHICMKSMQLLRSSWLLRIFFLGRVVLLVNIPTKRCFAQRLSRAAISLERQLASLLNQRFACL